MSVAGKVRLQSFLSDAGVASRRHAEELILEGKVLVNGRPIERLPAFVDPLRDEIVVNGSRVRPQPHEYFLVHKPRGVVCTDRDPAGRPRAADLLPPGRLRLFAVGRLDAESTGLLLMTNDGDLAARVTHPRYGIPKVYWVEVRGEVGEDLPERLKRGVYLEDGRASVSDVIVLHRGREASVLRIVLRERQNREIRRVLARLGYRVRKLKRIQIGPLTIKGLPRGASRRLLPEELAALRAAVDGTGPVDGTVGAPRPKRGKAPGSPRKAAGAPPRGKPAGPPNERAGPRQAAPDKGPPARPARKGPARQEPPEQRPPRQGSARKGPPGQARPGSGPPKKLAPRPGARRVGGRTDAGGPPQRKKPPGTEGPQRRIVD